MRILVPNLKQWARKNLVQRAVTSDLSFIERDFPVRVAMRRSSLKLGLTNFASWQGYLRRPLPPRKLILRRFPFGLNLDLGLGRGRVFGNGRRRIPRALRLSLPL